jgi:hypothetical protein
MIRGLSITKGKVSSDLSGCGSPQGSPEIRIKNMKATDLSRRQSLNSRAIDKQGQITGTTSEMGFGDFNDLRNMSLNQGGSFLQRQMPPDAPNSPVKFNRGNKFNRYEGG